MPRPEDSGRPPGKLVELIGISGAGKSTLCGLLRAELSRAGVLTVDSRQVLDAVRDHGFLARLLSCLGRPSKAEARRRHHFKRQLRRALRDFHRRHPGIEALVDARLARIRAGSREEEAELVAPWVAKHSAYLELLERTRGDWSLCLWEEGIAQRSVNLYALVGDLAETEEDRVEDFLARWPFPDALVHLEVSHETAFARMQERSRPQRLRAALDEIVARFLRRSEAVVQAILVEARRRAIPIFELDNERRQELGDLQPSGWEACLAGLARLAREVDRAT